MICQHVELLVGAALSCHSSMRLPQLQWLPERPYRTVEMSEAPEPYPLADGDKGFLHLALRRSVNKIATCKTSQ